MVAFKKEVQLFPLAGPQVTYKASLVHWPLCFMQPALLACEDAVWMMWSSGALNLGRGQLPWPAPGPQWRAQAGRAVARA